MKKNILVIFFLLIYAAAGNGYYIAYQGKLTDSDNRRINASVVIIFSIYSEETGTTELWTETHNSVNIVNGLFSVWLGSSNPINLKFDRQYYLGININNQGELTPRIKLNASAFAYRAKYSDTAAFLENNAIAEGAMIINDTLTVNSSFIIEKDGKVGINTLFPSEQLEVLGNAKISGSITAKSYSGDGSNLTNLQYNSLAGDKISRTEISELLNIVGNDTNNLNNRITGLENDSQNKTVILSIYGTRISNLENDSVTKTYVNTQLSTLSSDTQTLKNDLANYKILVYADTINLYNQLSLIRSDSVISIAFSKISGDTVTKSYVDADSQTKTAVLTNYGTRISNLENDSVTKTYVNTQLSNLSSDTQNLKNDLTNYKTLVNADTINLYNQLSLIRSDSVISIAFSKISGDTVTKSYVDADSQTKTAILSNYGTRISNLENDSVTKTYVNTQLSNLSSDTQTLKNDLANYKILVNADTMNLYNQLSLIRSDSVINIAFSKISGDTVTKSYVDADSQIKTTVLTNYGTRISNLENDSVTKTYVNTQLSNLSSDTQTLKNDLANYKILVYADTMNLYNQLSLIRSDSVISIAFSKISGDTVTKSYVDADSQIKTALLSNYGTRISNLENDSVTKTYVNTLLSNLSSDTQTLKNDLANYKILVNADTMNLYNQLSLIRSDSVINIAFSKISGDTVTKTYVDEQLSVKLNKNDSIVISRVSQLFNDSGFISNAGSSITQESADLRYIKKSDTIAADSIGTGAVNSIELSYLDNVSSNIQMQLNSKASNANPGITGGLLVSDTLAVGADTFIVLKNGNVGIGTTNPSARLTINGSNSSELLELSINYNSTTPSLAINNTSGNLASGSRISFKSSGTELANIIYQLGSGSTPSLQFGTNNNERMRITYNGKIGIGTVTPSDSLQVAGSIRGETLTITQRIYADTISAIKFYGDGSNLTGINSSGKFSGNVGDSIYITSTKVGIGTTVPNSHLEVAGDIRTSDLGGLYLRGGVSDTNHGLGYYHSAIREWTTGWGPDGPVLHGYGGGSLGTNQSGTKSTALVWNSSGQVGIGTNSPSYKLDVFNGPSRFINPNLYIGEIMRWQGSNSSSQYQMNLSAFSPSSNNVSYYFSMQDNDGSYDTFLIFNRGNIGVNIKTPLDKFHVNDSSAISGWRGRAVFSGANRSVVAGIFNDSAIIGAHNSALTAWDTLFINTQGNFAGGGNGSVILPTYVGIGTQSLTYALNFGTDKGMLLNALTYGFAIEPVTAATDYLNIKSVNAGTSSTNTDNILVITRAGKVGIGTTNPGSSLEIYNNSNPKIFLNYNGSTQYFLSGISNSLDFGNVGGSPAAIRFMPGNVTKVIIDNSGNVGIGTTSPSDSLTVTGAVGADNGEGRGFKLKKSDGNYAAILDIDNSNTMRLKVPGPDFFINPDTPAALNLNYNQGGQGHITMVAGNSTGNVGIGTTNPDRAKLVVNGFVSYDNDTYGYLTSNATTGISSGTNNTSIYANGRIVCPEFNAVSDARIKIEIPKTETKSNLEIINKLRPVDYKMKDEIHHGSKNKKGFFAQEVEKILPDAVSKSSDFVPDIFALSKSISYDNYLKILTITLDKPHNLQVGDKVKLISEKESFEKTVNTVFSLNTFSVGEWNLPTEKVFVYGKYVTDFRTLDYNQIFTAGISAIQELSKKNESLKKQIEQLKLKETLIIDLIKRIENLESKIK
ncbi:tail fiber domain-containing protein [Candidatus Dependentiae bacterium]|nr:tail fiber domain-containing protein [Candidatus Dependentiae bacterium]